MFSTFIRNPEDERKNVLLLQKREERRFDIPAISLKHFSFLTDLFAFLGHFPSSNTVWWSCLARNALHGKQLLSCKPFTNWPRDSKESRSDNGSGMSSFLCHALEQKEMGFFPLSFRPSTPLMILTACLKTYFIAKENKSCYIINPVLSAGWP